MTFGPRVPVSTGKSIEKPVALTVKVATSAGFELLTSLELGWGNFSTFRIGVAWPLVQADDLGQEGPVIVFQLGRPL